MRSWPRVAPILGDHPRAMPVAQGVVVPKSVTGPAGPSASGQFRKPKRDLARGGFVGVRAVYEVESHLDREISADRSGRSLQRVGRADELAGRRHRLVALEDGGNQRPAGDEGHEFAEEGLLAVLGVVHVRQLLVGLHQLQSDQPWALALET